jgi:DNA-binding CsgD family transcriptional regulator
MQKDAQLGDFSKSLISNIPADLSSETARYYKNVFKRFPEEAIYIYSFKENKMLYADGWEEVLGYRDDEISMLTIVMTSSKAFAPFSNELNDKALKFILSKTEELEKYSFTIELKKIHKNGSEIPMVAKVGVFESEHGRVTSIIGNFTINKSITFGKVMRYAAYGPEKNEFEEELNRSVLFKHLVISDKEKEALALAAKGLAFKEIAKALFVSASAIQKRIIPLYKRFKVKSLPHLISFAYDNHILP